MDNQIKYYFNNQEHYLTITKFKAFESLDFILSLCNFLPNDIKISEEVTIKKETIKYVIDIVMDIGENQSLHPDQQEYLKNLHEINILKLIFKEAFYNSGKEQRSLITNKLIGLLLQNNAPVQPELIDIIFDNPKKLFANLIKIFEFNYYNFFLITNA